MSLTSFYSSKSLLQYLTHKLNLPAPVYKKVRTVSQQKKKKWFIAAAIGGRTFPTASAMTRKEAERLAARRTMETISEEYSQKSFTLWILARYFPVTVASLVPMWLQLEKLW